MRVFNPPRIAIVKKRNGRKVLGSIADAVASGTQPLPIHGFGLTAGGGGAGCGQSSVRNGEAGRPSLL